MDVVFREATENDYNGIKDLSKDIYGTTDTLLFSLPDWLESVRWFVFVGEIDKTNIVAFTAIQLTDGVQGLNIRKSRVKKEYRGCGLYKDLLRYAVQYVRERVQSSRYIYLLSTAEVRVPNGFDVMKKRGLLKFFVNCSDPEVRSNYDVKQPRCHSLSWDEFKALCNRNNTLKDLFINGIMEIHCDVINLDCQENWKCLEERSEIRIMLTERGAKDGPPDMMISFLRLEKAFTNEGTAMFTMNVYGTNREAFRCHITAGLLEVGKHVGGGKVLIIVWMEVDLLEECKELLEELPCSNVHAVLQLNLLHGDLSKKLEGI